MSSSPTISGLPHAHVTRIEGGKTKEAIVQIVPKEDTFILQIFDTQITKWMKDEFHVKCILSEILSTDLSGKSLSITTPTSNIILVFPSKSEASQYHQFISARSIIAKENRTLAMMDEQLRAKFPYPQGMFFD